MRVECILVWGFDATWRRMKLSGGECALKLVVLRMQVAMLKMVASECVVRRRGGWRWRWRRRRSRCVDELTGGDEDGVHQAAGYCSCVALARLLVTRTSVLEPDADALRAQTERKRQLVHSAYLWIVSLLEGRLETIKLICKNNNTININTFK